VIITAGGFKMLWIEPSFLFYSGALGAFFGATVVSLALRRNHKQYMKMLESFWNQDIKRIERQIVEARNILPTISVENPVSKRHNYPYCNE
jgi:hypothetical protein